MKKSTSPFVIASGKKARAYTPIRAIDPSTSNISEKYPVYKLLKLAQLGFRPKRMPIKTALTHIEDMFSKSRGMNPNRFEKLFNAENGLGKFIKKHFDNQCGEKKGAAKTSEYSLINFLYTLEVYKEECLMCLLFGQFAAEIYPRELIRFAADLSFEVQEISSKSTISHLKKNATLSSYMIPFKRVRELIPRFLGTSNYLGESADTFMSLLIKEHPKVKINFTISYPELLYFCVELYIKREESVKQKDLSGIVFSDAYGRISAHKGFFENGDSCEYSELKQECKFRAVEYAEQFINGIMTASNPQTYKNTMELKKILLDKLHAKAEDLVSIVCDQDMQAWFQNLLIDNPSASDIDEWKRYSSIWRELCGKEEQTSDDIAEFVKKIMQTKKLIDEIIRLIAYLTSK